MLAANSLNEAPRPSVVLAHSDSKYLATVSRSFRRLHWQVLPAATPRPSGSWPASTIPS